MRKLHFTKRSVEALPFARTGQELYRDTTLRGLGVRVGRTSKVFFVEGQVSDRARRVTLARPVTYLLSQTCTRAPNPPMHLSTGVSASRF